MSNIGNDHKSHNLKDGMVMSFHGGYNEIILFDFWTTNSVGIFILSWLILFVAAFLYEGIKLFREVLIRFEQRKRQQIQLLRQNNSTKKSLLSRGHIIQTLLHMLQIAVSYLLMLVFMTYNTWLCLSVVLGAGLGYFIFGLKRLSAVDINEHCH